MSRIYRALTQSTESDHVLRWIEQEKDQIEVAVEHTTEVVDEPVDLPPATSAPGPSSPFSEYRSIAAMIPVGVPIFPFDGTDERAADEYRVLRTNIVQQGATLKMIAVTSATPGDGKTVTAVNLAAAMALRSDFRVLVVDGDLRRSAIAEVLGLDTRTGLADVLRGESRIEDAIVGISQIPKLWVLPAGRTQINPAELLDSALCRSVVATLRERFDYIIVDTPPVAVVADFKLLHELSDGALMVVRPDHTDRKLFLRALKDELKTKFLGVVINGYEDWFLWKIPGYYAYYSGSSKAGHRLNR